MPSAPPDYETGSRLSLLKGAASGGTPEPPSSPPSDILDAPEQLVIIARRTLREVADDPMEEAKDRVNAADSLLDRYGEPRRRHELGGSKVLAINVTSGALAGALQGMAKVFGKEIRDEDIHVEPLALPNPAVHGPRMEGSPEDP